MFPCISPEPLITKPTWATVHWSADDQTAHVTYELPFPCFIGALQEYLVFWICLSIREANVLMAALGNSHELGRLRYSQILSYTFSMGTNESDCTFADLRTKHLHCRQTTCWKSLLFYCWQLYPGQWCWLFALKWRQCYIFARTIFKLITMKSLAFFNI